MVSTLMVFHMFMVIALEVIIGWMPVTSKLTSKKTDFTVNLIWWGFLRLSHFIDHNYILTTKVKTMFLDLIIIILQYS